MPGGRVEGGRAACMVRAWQAPPWADVGDEQKADDGCVVCAECNGLRRDTTPAATAAAGGSVRTAAASRRWAAGARRRGDGNAAAAGAGWALSDRRTNFID